MLADAFVDAGLRGDEAGRHHHGRLAAGIQRINDVLQEQLVDFHLVRGLGFDLRNPGKEAFLVGFGVQLVAVIAEIQLERRIGDDVIETLQLAAVLMVGVQQGVALDDVGNGMHQVVQDQVQAQQVGGFLRNVLGVNAATAFADGMGHVHQQGAGTGGRVVTTDVFDVALPGFRHQNCGHDPGHRMRRVVFGVLAAAVVVVVLDQVFEEGGVEVEFLVEDALEAELHQFVDDGAAEVVAFGVVGDVVAEPVEQHDLGAAVGFDREDVVVADGNVAQGVVEQLGEIRRVLLTEQVSDEMARVSGARYPAPFAIAAFPDRLRSMRRWLASHLSALAMVSSELLGFEGELVVQELVEKDLGDDLEFVAVVAQAIVGADAFEAVDQVLWFFVEIPALPRTSSGIKFIQVFRDHQVIDVTGGVGVEFDFLLFHEAVDDQRHHRSLEIAFVIE